MKPIHQTENPPNTAQLEDTPTIPLSYIWLRAVVWKCSEGQTDTHMHVANIHFTSATPHAKCNDDQNYDCCQLPVLN